MIVSQTNRMESADPEAVTAVVETLRARFGADALPIAEAQQHVATVEMSGLWGDIVGRLQG